MRLCEMIGSKHAEIIQRWRAGVRGSATEAHMLSRSELEDNIPALLDEIVVALRHDDSISDGSPNATEHGRQRLRVGFDLSTVVREYGMLRNTILACAEDSGITPTLDEYRRLGDSLTVGITEAVVEYSKLRFRLFETFVSVLSRDLKNPLQAISTASEMLLRQPPIAAEVVARVSGQVAESARRIGRNIDQLLDVSRVGLGGGFAPHRQFFDLAEVAARVIGELASTHDDRHIDLSVAGACTGNWDPDRIAQMLTHLASNALIHGSPTEPIQLRLSDGGQTVLMELHNRGNPIPREEFTRIFEPFRQQSKTHGGLGLGLYIVREIVREHGGTIDLESSELDGTTFRVTLPKTAT